MANDGYKDYRSTIQPISAIPKYIFSGFEKACHFEYKFDSKTEQDLAFIVENDKDVVKWLRPAPNQFHIYWDNNSKRYEPDFIVETADEIYMIETKMLSQVKATDVISKKIAAEKYCKYVSDYADKHEGKKWEYHIIPHHLVNRTVSLKFLLSQSVQ